MDNPKYLLRNSYGIYHFRMVVPKRLRPALGQREVKRSLNTKSHATALRLARRYATFLELLFEQKVVTKADLEVVVDGLSTVKIAPPRKAKKVEYKLSPKRKRVSKPESKPVASQPAEDQEYETYGSVATRFIKHQRISKGWNTQTEKGYAAILDIVLEVFGDIPIRVIDHEMAEELRDVIMQLPPNRTRSAEWNTLSIKQIIKKKPEKTISARTTNTYLDRISAVFEWAKVRGIITVNPFVGLKVMISKKVSEQRKALELDDLQALFDKKHFIQNEERPSRYWIPIIALYSGMRMEEIAQLIKSDLKVLDGILCFDINDDGDKKLKTLNSTRLVPVHSEIIRLGFERYCAEKEDDERLFSDLSKTNGKWSHNFSKWFIRYRKKCGVVEPGKTFHSFRHTVATIWKRNEVHESIPATLLGHSAGGITYTRYGKGYEVEKLKKVIQLIAYPLSCYPALGGNKLNYRNPYVKKRSYI